MIIIFIVHLLFFSFLLLKTPLRSVCKSQLSSSAPVIVTFPVAIGSFSNTEDHRCSLRTSVLTINISTISINNQQSSVLTINNFSRAQCLQSSREGMFKIWAQVGLHNINSFSQRCPKQVKLQTKSTSKETTPAGYDTVDIAPLSMYKTASWTWFKSWAQ